MISSGLAQYKWLYQLSPIYLCGGLAGQMSGGQLPLVSLLPTSTSPFAPDPNLDDFFANFQPVAGASIIHNNLGKYPFANQSTAANAIITEPLVISMMMICPARYPGDKFAKQAIISSLQASLAQHALLGGTYMVATPSFVYTDAILLTMRAADMGETQDPQYRWQMDFEKPLITLADAQAAQNNLMGKLTNGTMVTPNASGEVSFTGMGITTGNPASGALPGAVQGQGGSPLGFGSQDGSSIALVGGVNPITGQVGQ